MERSRLSVFIGSSSEALDVARAVENHLRREVDVTKWTEADWSAGSSFLEWLVGAVWEYDFALMILSPDDWGTSRDETFKIPRANVIFELGLFMGRLGRTRTFIVQEQGLRLPSDLWGIRTFRYERRRGLAADLSAPANDIITQIKSQGPFRGTSKDHSE